MKTTDKNLIGLWVNLSRAYEIALLGGFSIKIVFEKDYVEGFDDYKTIKDFFEDVEFKADGDLTLEITKPDYSYNTKNCDTIKDIKARVRKSLPNKRPTSFKSKDACDALMRTATQRLSFSLSTVEKIKKVASVISQLHGAKFIETAHLAEAIHYNCYDYNLCVAENQTINFGKGIQVSLFDLEYKDIEAAVEYLQKIIK